MQRKKILLAIPTMSYVHTFLMSRVLDWVIQNKHKLSIFCTVNTQPVDRAREEIIDTFLKGDADYLLMVDSDTIPPLDAIDKMLNADKPIVSGLTPIIKIDEKTHDYYRFWNCIDNEGKMVQPDTGVVEIKQAGGSCLLIKREVIENTPRPLFRNTYTDDNGKDTFVSEDFYFISKAHKYGYQAYAETTIICNHHKDAIW